MRDPTTKTSPQRNGGAALRKLKRLAVQADAVGADDRGRIIALLDDIETVRRRIQQECAVLEQELRNAALRATAINAYTRNARSLRRAYRSSH